MTSLVEVLSIPLHKLRFLDVIEPEPLSAEELELAFHDYSADEVNAIIESLEWGSQNPDYPFVSLVRGIKFSNADAHRYIVNLLRQMKLHKAAREKRP